ncbi:MAG: 2Fe-2S iron-sulfur cluster binding domain-containing protein [Phycisphaerae bacterium]|nr:2Fe-2S iron-sulfur cluster binding domain-containing protein [Phycisphaerae bacterium]NIR66864.1 2Fe-2S iron-sulfur cluster binding domain-containing protein [candidate division Zixibacteria bacterium]NIP51282.1 2Fe-2S iron-sulfur cluster binding domain-containing protein [Phycisphaerae bacterium]NIS54019.1 2Fe-2S iron-sulfur cluster binding domain-containing protein [Phycisphaerae bacterium]NIU11627.1 2Fe-2S iron-sulfur cluster binding domain-containing protein [Phycisphaerae bacterium]
MIYVLSVISFAGLTVALAAMLMIAERLLINYGICKLDINAGEKPLEVDGGQTLLASLYANEIFIPSACGGKGTCGHCKISVLTGGGPVLPTETPLLTRKEIRSNVRLACQVKIREDIYVRIPEELLNVRMFTSTVESSIDLTYDMKEIRLRLQEPAEISHRPGQYVQVQAPSPEGPVFRAYSISSPVYEPNIVQLVVRLIPGGIGSTYLHNVQPGDTVYFTGPYGEFWLNEDPSVEIVCVGGGCGMAPMRNIILSLYEKWPERVCWLFFGCRSTRDIFYLKEWEEFSKKHPNFHVIYALSDELEEGEKWDGETGFIHLSADKHLEPDIRRQAFLCGPPLMIEAVTRVLLEKGIDSEDIFYDEF